MTWARELYPEGVGYRYETGGLMDDIRKLDIHKIRNYHRDNYRPDNLCLIVSGTIDRSKLLQVFNEIDGHIASKGPLPSRARPWTTMPQVPRRIENVTKRIQFPSEDDAGEVYMVWLGPRIDDHQACHALNILNAYLTDSSVSLLTKACVDSESAFASDIGYEVFQHEDTVSTLEISNVDIEDLDDVEDEVMELLIDHAEEGIDMRRMASVIEQTILLCHDQNEYRPHESILHECINDHMFGRLDGSDLASYVNQVSFLRALSAWTSDEWVAFLKKYYIDGARITVIAEPSAEMVKTLVAENDQRILSNQKKNGADGLARLGQIFNDAKTANDVDIPPNVFDFFQPPDASKIPAVSISTFINPIGHKHGALAKPLDLYLSADADASSLL